MQTIRQDRVPLERFQALPRNPKEHDIGAILLSLQRFGFIEPVVVNEITGHLLSGHGRVMALRVMKADGHKPPDGITTSDGSWLVPTDFVPVPEDQEEAAAVALNRTVELGGWDESMLAQVLGDLASGEIGLDGTGYDTQELDGLLRLLNPPSLAELVQEHGELVDQDTWPILSLSVRVPPEVFNKWQAAYGTASRSKEPWQVIEMLADLMGAG